MIVWSIVALILSFCTLTRRAMNFFSFQTLPDTSYSVCLCLIAAEAPMSLWPQLAGVVFARLSP